jgi:hypothetical protein
MDAALEDRLKAAFPRLYRAGVSCECHNGWFALVWRLSGQLEELISQGPEAEQATYFAVQVKEKWGQLRFYLSASTEAMFQATEAALEESGYLCEVCGAPGTIVHQSGWVMARCPSHAPRGSQQVASGQSHQGNLTAQALDRG